MSEFDEYWGAKEAYTAWEVAEWLSARILEKAREQKIHYEGLMKINQGRTIVGEGDFILLPDLEAIIKEITE